jgi:hypothetical protein
MFDIEKKLTNLFRGGLVSAALVFLTACGQSQSGIEQARLPISINEVMASLINHSSDPIWVASWRNPQNDSDWRELEHLSKQLQIGGILLSMPGTGPLDDEWTSNSDWLAYADQLSSAAGNAVIAAQSRNVESISQAGDEIVAVCGSCHADFKPNRPTMNIYGELSPLPPDL